MSQGQVIDGYVVVHAVKLDGFTEIVAETIAEENKRYRLFIAEANNAFGIIQYTVVFESNDYLLAMREFTRRLDARLDTLDLDRVYRGSPLLTDSPLAAKDCVLEGLDTDLTDKVVAIKTGVLSPEFRSLSHQMHLVTGGFGASPTARGQAVFCTNLYSGEATRFDRADILGAIAEVSLPVWAADKLNKLREKLREKSEQRRPAQYESVIEKIEEGRRQQKERQAKPKPPQPSKRRSKSEPEL